MSTDDASLSRCCFGIVSAVGGVSVVWSCLGDVAVTSPIVSVMFFVISRFCLGGVSVMSR